MSDLLTVMDLPVMPWRGCLAQAPTGGVPVRAAPFLPTRAGRGARFNPRQAAGHAPMNAVQEITPRPASLSAAPAGALQH